MNLVFTWRAAHRCNAIVRRRSRVGVGSGWRANRRLLSHRCLPLSRGTLGDGIGLKPLTRFPDIGHSGEQRGTGGVTGDSSASASRCQGIAALLSPLSPDVPWHSRGQEQGEQNRCPPLSPAVSGTPGTPGQRGQRGQQWATLAGVGVGSKGGCINTWWGVQILFESKSKRRPKLTTHLSLSSRTVSAQQTIPDRPDNSPPSPTV